MRRRSCDRGSPDLSGIGDLRHGNPLTTPGGTLVKRDLNKILAMMTGAAFFALFGGAALWRLGTFWPNAQWTGLFVTVSGVGLYLGALAPFRRLYRQINGT